MRKKDLLNINSDLFSKSRDLKAENERVKAENQELREKIREQNEEILSLKAQIDSLNTKLNSTDSLKKLEERVTAQAEISGDTQYGSEIIGKIVISATKHCNSLTNESAVEMTKEMVNLILGRTEVAKSEILRIISLDISLEEKKELIDEQYKSAEDYFISVEAQRE